ncbi:MAG: exodeoxyribonuclease VII large subunit [Firmicutes bacterium]|jgi:exodeoxyribonuclease VII large subunit|nr:exodeoxyribonuclease VII large subunit [Bacillota bacterium]
MRLKSFSVSQVNNYIKRIISYDPILSNITVEGEISNFKRHSSGHAYFSIKDDTSKLNCVMFRLNLEKITFPIVDGMNVSIKGNINVYERDGKYQLYAEKINLLGEGELKEKFEKLKKKLGDEGLFDPNIKKELPKFPSKIAVITSPTGAAVKDVISVAKRRNDSIEIIIAPVRIQGEFSKKEIVKAIEDVNNLENIDLIILSRGGGSIEELWAFNEEVVARAIYESEVPIISGVGHETDFTISDFVSDFRAPTPSAAAEVAIPQKKQIINELDFLISSIKHSINKKVEIRCSEIEGFSPASYKNILNSKIKNYNRDITLEINRASEILANNLTRYELELDYIFNNLNNLNPLNILQKGYTVVENSKGSVLTSGMDLKKDDEIDIIFSDSIVKARVLERNENSEFKKL